MTTNDCAKKLGEHLNNSKCHNFHTVKRSEYDYFIKCAGYLSQDENYWNKNTFRISHMGIKYDIENQIIVDDHTICKDKNWRIEVY